LEGRVHTAHDDVLRRWYSYVEGEREPFGFEYHKDRAIQIGQDTARYHQTEHLIHDESGEVEFIHSYRDDATG